MVIVEGWAPQIGRGRLGPGRVAGIPRLDDVGNAAAATDPLAEAELVEAGLAEVVPVEAVLAGVVAGRLALPVDEEPLQPAARLTRGGEHRRPRRLRHRWPFPSCA